MFWALTTTRSKAVAIPLRSLNHADRVCEILRFPYYYRPWTLDHFKKKTELSQQLADPKHDAWECNYLYGHRPHSPTAATEQG